MDPGLQFPDFESSTPEFDAVALARSVEKALTIIMPWCHMQNPWNPIVAKEVREPAILYARAIDCSVGAANLGFAMAEEALSLVDLIPQTTPQERIEYLEGFNEMAKKGLAKATEAKNGFVNVRKAMETALSKMKVDDFEIQLEVSNASLGKTIQRPCTEAKSELLRGIKDLEEFSNMLRGFISWWNFMAMETNTLCGQGEVVMQKSKVLKYDKLRISSIGVKWKDHRKRYAAYVNEIGFVQDRYPKFFCEAKLPALEQQSSAPSTLNKIILRAPTSPNLAALADSTSLAFKLLRPWCISEYSSTALVAIKSQAQCYAKAVDSSITAAQAGFNIAEEALGFAALIDTTNEKDLQVYLHEMLAIARRGEENARRAHSSFRDVRATVQKLIRAARAEHRTEQQSGHIASGTANKLNELENGISALENFSSCIGFYISWWNVMRMSELSQATRLDPEVIVDYNSLREKDVVNTWRLLRQEYINYTHKVMEIQDSNRELFGVGLANAGTATISSNFPKDPDLPTRKKVTSVLRSFFSGR